MIAADRGSSLPVATRATLVNNYSQLIIVIIIINK